MTFVTIRHNGDQHDLSVPRGTTVAGLLAMLEVDTSNGQYAVSLPNGQEASLSAALGHDLPSGSIISVTGTAASRQAEIEARERIESPWFNHALTRASVAFFLIPLHTLGVLLPLLGLLPTPSLGLRILIATLSTLILGSMLIYRVHHRSAGDHLFLTLLAGSTLLALLPSSPQAHALAPMTVTTGAFLTSLTLWIRSRSYTAATFVFLWAGGAVLTLLSSFLSIPLTALAPLALAFAIWGIASTSAFSLRVPDSQLIDLPLVRTVAPSVRAPHTPSPAKITAARVMRTIREGQEISRSLTAAWSLLALICIPLVSINLDTPSLQGWASLPLLLAATVSLSLLPRTAKGRGIHLLPRIPAIAGFIALIITINAHWEFTPTGTVLALVVTAFLIVTTTLSLSQRPHSAFIGRTADILQALSLLLLLPSSALASGLFDFIRQVAS